MAYSTPVATPVILSCVFPPLAVLFVIARFYARRLKNAALKVDDWMLIPSLVLVLGSTVPLLISACYGNLGKRVDLTPAGTPVVDEEYVVFQKTFMIMQIMMTASLAVVRLTILLLYYRIFAQGGAKFKWSMITVVILNGAWGITFIFVHLFNCYPVEDTWTFSSGSEPRRCLTPGTFTHVRVFAISSAVIDALMLALPWPMVLSLGLPGRQKAAILSIFALGTIVLGAAIGKAVTMFQVTSTVQSSGPKQIQYDEAPYLYWTVPETCIALICACLPTLRPLLVSFASLPSNHVHSLRSRITGSTSADGGTAHEHSANAKPSGGDKFSPSSRQRDSHAGAESESVQNLNGGGRSGSSGGGLTPEYADVELASLRNSGTKGSSL